MPYTPKVVCRGGCGRPVVSGYCEVCRSKGRPGLERKSSAKRGYGRRWRRYRDAFLETHRLCTGIVRLADGRQITRHVGIVILATDVDHVIAVEGETDPLFYVEENHQALCHECHSFKTALENGAFGNAKAFAR